MTMKIDYRYNKIRPEWVLAYRARYNRWLKEPNRLVVWDVRNNVEKQFPKDELLVQMGVEGYVSITSGECGK